MKRIALLMLLTLLLAGCAASVPVPAEETATPMTAAAETTVPETEEAFTVFVETEAAQEHFLLTFVGDCTFGASPANYYAGVGFIKTVGEDYGYPFRNVMEWFGSDELTCINLEGPLTDVGNPMQKKHTFRGPTAYVRILTENSVEAVTIANNHSHDYGQSGYDSTVTTLREAEIPFVERDSSCILTTENGLKVGFYGAVYYLLDPEVITAEIRMLKEQGCDLVVFAPHWGVEGTYRPSQEQTRLAYAAIDAGADIVWGSHPHVLQPVEWYGNGVIYYSLGNFSFGGNGYPRDYDTVLLQQEVIRDADGSLSLGELLMVPCSVSSVSDRNNYQPTPLEPGAEAYARVLQKLDGTWDGPNLPIQ